MRGEFTSFKRWLQTSWGCHRNCATGNALAGQEQAPRVTNIIHRLKREPSALRLWRSVDLLSNRVLEPFLSRIDGEITRNAQELKVTNREEREQELSNWGWTEEEEEPLEGCVRGINTPNPNSQLSYGSATAQLQQCRTTAVPLFRCGTAAPGKTTRVKTVKVRLSWLSNGGSMCIRLSTWLHTLARLLCPPLQYDIPILKFEI